METTCNYRTFAYRCIAFFMAAVYITALAAVIGAGCLLSIRPIIIKLFCTAWTSMHFVIATYLLVKIRRAAKYDIPDDRIFGRDTVYMAIAEEEYPSVLTQTEEDTDE